ncbi:hypothetical protein WL17_11740 [Burkholderia ubonensis]|nr:hypothetical protein WL17_11740 [Burkholderia ubonensis]
MGTVLKRRHCKCLAARFCLKLELIQLFCSGSICNLSAVACLSEISKPWNLRYAVTLFIGELIYKQR